MGDSFIGGMLLFYLAALAISITVTYYLIQAATKTNKRFKYEILRTKLLMKIAEKNGVSSDEINQLVNEEF
ncbi:MAG TPA: hypothetical protein VL053_15940 [Arachidicoccus sp.]|nr:hypothetical protein [Arachidicoccus sp.]